MTWQMALTFFSPLDWIAAILLLICWLGLTVLIENPPVSRPSMSKLMAQHRRNWMVHMITRQPRIFDSQTLASLRQGTAFFTSATMIAIGGGLALIANPDQLAGVVSDLSDSEAPRIVWDIKIILILLLLTNAFLKFVWCHRLFGYCHVLMGAVPNDPDDPKALPLAKKAGEVNIFAARSYNRGLRSVYFGLAACAWFLGPQALILTTVVTVIVMLRREFASQSRAVLLQSDV